MRYLQGLVWAVGLWASAAHGEEPLSPVAAAARFPKFVDAKISPKGTYLAVASQESGQRTLVFIDLRSRKIASVLKPDSEDMVGAFVWANDHRVVTQIVSQDGSLAQPTNHGELYAVNADGKGGQMIFGYRAGQMQTGSVLRRGERDYGAAWVVDRLLHDENHVLIAAFSFEDNPDERRLKLYRLDVESGAKDLVAEAPATLTNAAVMTDELGQPRIFVGSDVDLHAHIYYREKGRDWSEIGGLKWMTKESEPFDFVAGDRMLYVADSAPGGFGLYAVSIDTGARKLLASGKVPPRFSVNDRATGHVVAVEFEPDLQSYSFIEPEHPMARLIRDLQASFPDEMVRIVSRTEDDRLVVARIWSDRDPGRFFLVDVERRRSEPIVEARPWVKPAEMAPTSAFHIAASDGLLIHGYFTIPAGAAAKGPPPLVVMPHGGPHGIRTTWGFDPEVQLLASCGFAVLEVNYRGSGGYGRSYEEAGYRHWGDRVVEDIIDATGWMIKKGLVDPQRICTFGASFGGYAALQATVLAPGRFRCAVGYAGVYDLALMSKVGDVQETRLGRAYLHAVVGDDPEALRKASPVKNADKIGARVLLIHGEGDQRAPIDHAEALRDALTAHGNPPEWLVEPDEGHGFYDERARQRMYARLITFLEANTRLPPAAPKH